MSSIPPLLQGNKGITLTTLPAQIVQTFIFSHFSALELFKLRLLSPDWNDTIKNIWCHRVKDEMMEQIQSLDLLYEKETTAKILEHKIKHLRMYSNMMNGFAQRMNMSILSHNLLATMQSNLIMLVLMTVMIIKPELELLIRPSHLTQSKIKEAIAYLTGDIAENAEDLLIFNSVRSPPALTIEDIKLLRTEYYEKFATNQALASIQAHQNIARVFVTWIDAAVEFTILKHQVRLIRLQYANVLKAMQSVTSKWPKKKKFIQGAYKLLLFSRSMHPMTREVYKKLSQLEEMKPYYNFKLSKARAKLKLDGETEPVDQEEQDKKQHELVVQNENQSALRNKINTVEKGMNFLEKAYSIQTMLMQIMKETKEEQNDISADLEVLQESTSTIGIQAEPPQEVEQHEHHHEEHPEGGGGEKGELRHEQ